MVDDKRAAPVAKAGPRGWLSAVAVALVVAVANLLIWTWVHAPTHPPDWDGSIGGFAYSAFQRDQSPINYSYPTNEQIESDLILLKRWSPRIRTYASAESDHIPMLAQRHGLEMMGGAWLDRRVANNEAEIEALIRSSVRHANITRVVVGNEAILRGDLLPEQLIPYLDRVRKRLDIPVSTAEPWHVWLKYPELAEHVDFITVHLLPYWEGLSRRSSVRNVLERYDELVEAFPGKPIVIGEVGWPTNGDRFRNATASTENAARFLRQFMREAQERDLDYYIMEAFDQPWKEAGEGRVGAYWGMFDAFRQPKYPLAGPVEEDPTWRIKAWAAAALAFVPIMIFAVVFRRLRPTGRLFFAGLIQTAAAVLIWSISLPYEFYLEPLDWAMLGVLIPAQLAIIAVLLINGFEFTEALWNRGWLRRFRPLDALPVIAPKVSIHLPCHNEPPEMVIQTLDSLALLDYPDFEVIVVDNNTHDEAVWRPVAAHCAKLGARFRFFHLDPWPGFKAGALNFALTQTDPAAGVVAVVDSDYVVRPDWLRALVGYFQDARVGVVQAPQAHRDFAGNAFRRMSNWEYEGFFRIGMHHRNERDAIIQHGTMTMIRRELLDRLGWAEWCICEDAELGLRVLENGCETVYVDEAFGRGVTPADFAAYKSQRFRWAFGAMQILRRHWRELLHRGSLTAGQRYHFLTGWFSWFADALHLVFTLLALVWTVGMLVVPSWFALPHALFLVPVLGFFVAKALFGVVLYRARVPCGWLDTLGASVASMALSHAVARGVFRGLVAREHPFTRTAKRRRLNRRPSAFTAVREELTLLIVLVASIVAMTLWPGRGEIEAVLWRIILAAQAIPYLSAVVAASISAYSADLGEEPAASERSAVTAPDMPAVEPVI
jgi:exo-beta-1,3-glucanase (GH17 family)/cellulose synthase/poly-beta-1,6-N-acetylglucosamine synthase-like glycosyltransferase